MSKLSTEIVVAIFQSATLITALFQDRTAISRWKTTIDLDPDTPSIAFRWQIDSKIFGVSRHLEPILLTQCSFYLANVCSEIKEQIRSSIIEACPYTNTSARDQ
jgi:hypothetical protein